MFKIEDPGAREGDDAVIDDPLLPERHSASPTVSESVHEDTDSEISSAARPSGPCVDVHPMAGKSFGQGTPVFEGLVPLEEFNRLGKGNRFYTFKNQDDWEVAEWLINSNLPMSEINKFLKLTFVSERKAVSGVH